MLFFGIVMILLIVVLIESLQKRVDDSYSQDIEKKHKELIDMYQGNPLVVRELKARTETMIHSGMKEYQNIEYQPKGIKEVTTPEERAARRKAQLAGKKYVHEWTENQINDVIKDMLDMTGAAREELALIIAYGGEKIAQTYSKECEVNIEDARFVIQQVEAVLNGEKMPEKRQKKRNRNSIVQGEKLYELNGVAMRSMKSSSVRAAGYDEIKMILYVEFIGGATYEYLDVPSNEYINFINSSSPGRYVNNVLTSKYEYRSIVNE